LTESITPRDALSQIASAADRAAPFAHPEVVRLDGGLEGVRMQVGRHQYLQLTLVDGRWMCQDVYVDGATGESDADPLTQRLMRESYRALPVADSRDLADVARRFVRRAVTGWRVTAQHALATEREREWAAEALGRLGAEVSDRRPKRT
jgi:hypothetical protein